MPVFEPPVSPPLPPIPDDGSSLAALTYQDLGWFRELDEEGPGDLRLVIEALSRPSQQTYDVVRPRTDRDGWDIALDPDEAPASFLRWLAQWVGVEPKPEMSEQQLRDEIREPTGWKRGQPEALRVSVRSTLIPVVEGEDLLVIIHPNVPEVGRHYVRTLLSQTPEPDRTEAVLRAKLPWWQRLDYEAMTDPTWADLSASTNWTTWADLTADPDFADWQDLTEITVEDL